MSKQMVEVGQIWADIQYPYVFKVTSIEKRIHPETKKEHEVVVGLDVNDGREIVDYIGKFGFFYRLRENDDTRSEWRISIDRLIEEQKLANVIKDEDRVGYNE